VRDTHTGGALRSSRALDAHTGGALRSTRARIARPSRVSGESGNLAAHKIALATQELLSRQQSELRRKHHQQAAVVIRCAQLAPRLSGMMTSSRDDDAAEQSQAAQVAGVTRCRFSVSDFRFQN